MAGLVLVGLMTLGAAWFVAWMAQRQGRRGLEAQLASEIPLAQLANDVAEVAKEVGPGAFRQEVRIRGTIETDEPLRAELSSTPCVCYRFSVTREYESVLWETTAEGRSVQRIERKSEIVAGNERRGAFYIRDTSGRLPVLPEGIQWEGVKTVSHFDSRAPQGFMVIPETLGYRQEEFCLPVGTEVTIVAEASDGGGNLALQKPEKDSGVFVVTPKPFREWKKSLDLRVSVLKGVSIGLTVLGIGIFLMGVFR